MSQSTFKSMSESASIIMGTMSSDSKRESNRGIWKLKKIIIQMNLVVGGRCQNNYMSTV